MPAKLLAFSPSGRPSYETYGPTSLDSRQILERSARATHLDRLRVLRLRDPVGAAAVDAMIDELYGRLF